METFGSINVNGEDVELSRENTTIYRHLGAVASQFDHVFVTVTPELGTYFWRYAPMSGEETQVFQDLVEASDGYNVPSHENIPDVSELDRETYIRHAMADVAISDFFPGEWADGTSES